MVLSLLLLGESGLNVSFVTGAVCLDPAVRLYRAGQPTGNLGLSYVAVAVGACQGTGLLLAAGILLLGVVCWRRLHGWTKGLGVLAILGFAAAAAIFLTLPLWCPA